MIVLVVEVVSGDMLVGLCIVVRDKWFIWSGIGYWMQKELMSLNFGVVGQVFLLIMYLDGYVSGVVIGRCGMQEWGSMVWEMVQEVVSLLIWLCVMLECFGLLEVFFLWFRGKGEEEKEVFLLWFWKDGDEEEQKEVVVQFVCENMGVFFCEEDVRIVFVVLSQFVDGDIFDNFQQVIEDQYGDFMEQLEGEDWEDYLDDMLLMMEGGFWEVFLDVQKCNVLDFFDFVFFGCWYFIDILV